MADSKKIEPSWRRPLYLHLNDEVSLGVEPDGVTVNPSWEGVPVSTEDLTLVAHWLVKIKNDLDEGVIEFEPTPLHPDDTYPEARDCPVCGHSPVVKDEPLYIWDLKSYGNKEATCGELYMKGIPYRWLDCFDVSCPVCGLTVSAHVSSNASDTLRHEVFRGLVGDWNSYTPSDTEKKNAEARLELVRANERRERERAESEAKERAEFEARKARFKKDMGWE